MENLLDTFAATEAGTQAARDAAKRVVAYANKRPMAECLLSGAQIRLLKQARHEAQH